MREVARRVHLQAPSLHAYFPSKAALYDALFLLGIRRYGANKDRSTQELDSFWDHLHAWFVTYMQFAQDHPDLYQLAFEQPVPGFVPSEESMAESRQLLGGVEELFDEAVAEGWMRPPIAHKCSLTRADSEELISLLRDHGTDVAVASTLSLCRDPDDDVVLETAIRGNADTVVSRDEDIKGDAGLVRLLQAAGVEAISVA
ncbi:MAG TPA: putative toxin-antitoxin system toxin component, PIN family [Chloroflexota bacterium]